MCLGSEVSGYPLDHAAPVHLFGQQLIHNARVTWNNKGQVSGPRL